MAKKKEISYRINRQIRVSEVRLVGDNVEPGVYDIKKALLMANELDLDLVKLHEKLSKVSKSIENLLDLAEAFGATSVGERIREHEQEQTILRAQIRQLEDRKNISKNVDLSSEDLRIALQRWRNQIAHASSNGDVQAQRKLLRQFVSKIEMGYSEIHIWYTYPLDHVESSENYTAVDLRSK